MENAKLLRRLLSQSPLPYRVRPFFPRHQRQSLCPGLVFPNPLHLLTTVAAGANLKRNRKVRKVREALLVLGVLMIRGINQTPVAMKKVRETPKSHLAVLEILAVHLEFLEVNLKLFPHPRPLT